MALIVTADAVSSDGGNTATTAGVDTTGASLLVAQISDFAGATASAISDSKSNTWTPLTAVTAGSVSRSHLFYCANPTVGSGHTFTATGSSSFPSIQVQAWSPVQVFDQLVTNGQAGLPTENQVGSLTPPVHNCVFVSGLSFDDVEVSANLTIDSGFTRSSFSNFTSGQSLGGAMAYFEQGTAAAKNPLWNYATALNTAASMATFKPSGIRFILGTH